VSLNTVKTRARNIYAKLRMSSPEQAVVQVRRLGLLRRPERPPTTV
jgi:ATP/maltotriose-dependent transcriptional regulator MalT